MTDTHEDIIGYLLTQKPNEVEQLYKMAISNAKANYHHSAVFNSLLRALYVEGLADGMEVGQRTARRR